jgi:hypothetical protein
MVYQKARPNGKKETREFEACISNADVAVGQLNGLATGRQRDFFACADKDRMGQSRPASKWCACGAFSPFSVSVDLPSTCWSASYDELSSGRGDRVHGVVVVRWVVLVR